MRLYAEFCASKNYLKFGYCIDWIYGVSELSKDSDRLYYVDIRDFLQINGDYVTISIKEDLYQLLEHSEKNTTEIQLDEDHSALYKGIEKQKRWFIYSNNSPFYYQANIRTRDFNKIEPDQKKKGKC